MMIFYRGDLDFVFFARTPTGRRAEDEAPDLARIRAKSQQTFGDVLKIIKGVGVTWETWRITERRSHNCILELVIIE